MRKLLSDIFFWMVVISVGGLIFFVFGLAAYMIGMGLGQESVPKGYYENGG